MSSCVAAVKFVQLPHSLTYRLLLITNDSPETPPARPACYSTAQHPVAPTPACRRTFKFLMGLLGGAWVVGEDWLAACLAAGGPVEEGGFEVGGLAGGWCARRVGIGS